MLLGVFRFHAFDRERGEGLGTIAFACVNLTAYIYICIYHKIFSILRAGSMELDIRKDRYDIQTVLTLQ